MTLSRNKGAEAVNRLVEEFLKLPSVGIKTAQRLTYYLVRMPEQEARLLAQSILAVKERIIHCTRCYNITEEDPCDVCTDPRRDQSRICVVEEALDVLAIEHTGAYKGLYHVLQGVISPMNGVGPDDLHIEPLLARLKNGEVKEVFIATNPNLEGEATSMYIRRLIESLGLKVTRPRVGLPMGGDLEYADQTTLKHAIEGRQDL